MTHNVVGNIVIVIWDATFLIISSITISLLNGVLAHDENSATGIIKSQEFSMSQVRWLISIVLHSETMLLIPALLCFLYISLIFQETVVFTFLLEIFRVQIQIFFIQSKAQHLFMLHVNMVKLVR